MPEPPVVSRQAPGDEAGPESLRDFLENLVKEAASRGVCMVGEAEPGRYVLVSPPLAPDAMKAQIDAGVAAVLERLGRRWPGPHVTDFGLREVYAPARDPWLARRGLESLVKEGKLGVVTIFCHEWVYEVCAGVAAENGIGLLSPLGEYLRTGKVRLGGTNAFQLDVFTNLKDLAASFDTIEVLATKVLVLAGLSDDESLAARLRGKT